MVILNFKYSIINNYNSVCNLKHCHDTDTDTEISLFKKQLLNRYTNKTFK